MKITNPELEVVRFSADDVIATSIGALTGKIGTFYIDNGNGGYDSYNGTFGSYNGSVYVIDDIYLVSKNVGDEMGELQSGGSVVINGVTIPAFPEMESFAKGTYDATFNGSAYYSDGVSYYDEYWNQ